MEIKVLYFGEIAEWKGCAEELKQLNSSITTDEFVGSLVKEIPQLAQINYAIAVNRNMIDAPVELLNGYEVSVFPPFAGG